MRITCLAVVIVVLLAGCNWLPSENSEFKADIESKYGVTVGVVGSTGPLGLISFYDTAKFSLNDEERRQFADAIAGEMYAHYGDTIGGFSVLIGEDEPQRGMAFNYVYEIRAGAPRFKEMARPIATPN